MALGDVVRDAAKDAGVGANRLAPTAELGSQQLANLVGRAMSGGGPQSVEGLLKQLAEINRQQLEAARQLVQQGGQKPPVLIMPE